MSGTVKLVAAAMCHAEPLARKTELTSRVMLLLGKKLLSRGTGQGAAGWGSVVGGECQLEKTDLLEDSPGKSQAGSAQ